MESRCHFSVVCVAGSQERIVDFTDLMTDSVLKNRIYLMDAF